MHNKNINGGNTHTSTQHLQNQHKNTLPVVYSYVHLENLLRTSWEEHESLVLEHNGKPVAAIVPMDEYRRWYSDTGENAFDYELPTDLLEAYHKLLDKKFSTGLTPQEEVELTPLDQQLNEAEAAQPLIQSMQKREALRDENWTQRFEEIIKQTVEW